MYDETKETRMCQFLSCLKVIFWTLSENRAIYERSNFLGHFLPFFGIVYLRNIGHQNGVRWKDMNDNLIFRTGYSVPAFNFFHLARCANFLVIEQQNNAT